MGWRCRWSYQDYEEVPVASCFAESLGCLHLNLVYWKAEQSTYGQGTILVTEIFEHLDT